MMKNQLSKLPYKGTTDIYPKDMLSRNYLFNIWRKVAENFGYEEYDTPMLEEADLYRVKSGEEIANNQLYNFIDKGGREIALRPEMTPSLARMIAAKKNELVFPLRWFNIGRYYRYEKPQRGRSREFFQLNIDIFGITTIEAEIEIIQYVMAIMKELKAPKDTYELRISNRYLLDYLFEKILKIDSEQKSVVAKAIDNYLKLDKDTFPEYLEEIGLNKEQSEKLLDFLKWEIKDLEKIISESKGAEELINLFNKAESLSISNIKFCPYIVRGLQYYTGTVIEMFDIGSKDNPRALFGGGRYDNLLEIFEEGNIPAFGLGWGDVVMMDYLKTYNLLPEIKTNTQVFVALMNESLYTETSKAVEFLRENDINTQMQLTPSKLSNQLKYASKKSIPWTMIIGEEEIEKQTVTLKNMESSEQFNIPLEEAVQKIK